MGNTSRIVMVTILLILNNSQTSIRRLTTLMLAFNDLNSRISNNLLASQIIWNWSLRITRNPNYYRQRIWAQTRQVWFTPHLPSISLSLNSWQERLKKALFRALGINLKRLNNRKTNHCAKWANFIHFLDTPPQDFNYKFSNQWLVLKSFLISGTDLFRLRREDGGGGSKPKFNWIKKILN